MYSTDEDMLEKFKKLIDEKKEIDREVAIFSEELEDY